MRARDDRRISDFVAVAGGVVLAACLGYLLVRALTGYDLADTLASPGEDVVVRDRATLWPWVAGALLGAVALTAGWLLGRADGRGRAAAEARADELRAERDELSDKLGRERSERRDEVSKERALRARIERARRAEREWNRELREQVLHLHRERGALGDHRDIRDLVLRIALELLEADKGLLVSHDDGDGDGDLDVVRAHGFDNDASDSRLAQQFAEQVIDRDTTVRDDAWAQQENATAADREIENLVAIPIYIRDEFRGAIVAANKEGGFDEDDDEVLLSLGDHAGALLERSQLHGELRRSYLATVRLLADAIEIKDPFLRGHSDDVSRYVLAVADRLGFAARHREELLFGSLLHDVGKIGISERILLKPGRLTAEERSIINLHPRIGYRLVEQVPALKPIARGVLHHHERWDGDGYPSGLRGEQIPVEARIIAVVDSFSAMTQDRPYRDAMSVEDACAELERCAGTQFDPEVVRTFVEEVRSRPPSVIKPDAAAALDDPDVESLRTPDEPLLGYGSFSLVDSLTMLYTRRYLHELVAAEAERSEVQGRPFAIVMAELATIDEINARDGYGAGDVAIQSVAQSFQRAASRTGGIAARCGGHRFALLQSGADDAAARSLAAELESSVGDGLTLRTASGAWQPGESGEQVLARVRGALVQRHTPV
jgi:diguanylate cyclase (GGDEF)-like protein